MRSKTKEVLKQIAANPKLEARWLNTLSLLEFIGARKIAKTVASKKHPPLFILEHQADETRHAFVFKKLAEEEESIHETDYLCGEEGIHYFQSLDQASEGWLREKVRKDVFANYLLTTTLIERRAIQLYPLYRSLTKNKNVKNALTQIIVEESNHRKPIEEKLMAFLKKNGVKSLTPCLQKEEKLMNAFIRSVHKAVNTSA